MILDTIDVYVCYTIIRQKQWGKNNSYFISQCLTTNNTQVNIAHHMIIMHSHSYFCELYLFHAHGYCRLILPPVDCRNIMLNVWHRWRIVSCLLKYRHAPISLFWLMWQNDYNSISCQTSLYSCFKIIGSKKTVGFSIKAERDICFSHW